MNVADLVEEFTATLSAATINLTGATSVEVRTFAASFTVGATRIPLSIRDALGNFETGYYTLTSATVLTRTEILSSSNGGAAVTFPAGTKRVTCGLLAGMIADFALMSEGVDAADLPTATTIAGGDYLMLVQGGIEKKILASTVQTFMGVVADTTAPTLSSPTGTQTGTTTASGTVTTNEANGTLYFLATTGSTATAAAVKAGGTQAITSTGSKSVSVTGLTASTLYYMHYLHRDAAGNDSTVSTSASFTTAAVGDTTAPVLSAPLGTQTGSTTASGGATTDEANGTLYRYASTNATETAATIKAANLTTTVSATGAIAVTFTGLTASTVYYAHYVHRDAAGNDSNVVSSASFATAASGSAYTITVFSGGGINATLDAGSANASTTQGTMRGFLPAKTMSSAYWGFSPTTASARCGWSTSATVPPSNITQSQNASGASSVNGMVPMIAQTSPNYSDPGYLWITIGSGSSTWYFWIEGADGVPVCKNPSGMAVTGA